MFQKSSLTALLLIAAMMTQTCESLTVSFMDVWFKRPYKGPQCIVEIVGADLDPVSNKRFDWVKPDIMVKCTHSKWTAETSIEGNTYQPRWVWQTKMPHKEEKGFAFTVYDVNVLKGNEVIGRSFLTAIEANELKATDSSKVLSLGDGIGSLKVSISQLPAKLDGKIMKLPELKAVMDVPKIE